MEAFLIRDYLLRRAVANLQDFFFFFPPRTLVTDLRTVCQPPRTSHIPGFSCYVSSLYTSRAAWCLTLFVGCALFPSVRTRDMVKQLGGRTREIVNKKIPVINVVSRMYGMICTTHVQYTVQIYKNTLFVQYVHGYFSMSERPMCSCTSSLHRMSYLGLNRNTTCIWYVEVWEPKLYFYPSARGFKKKKKKKNLGVEHTHEQFQMRK